MKMWDGEKEVEIEKADAFIADILAVYKKHGLSISHEDHQGSFEIVPYSEQNAEWLKNATWIYAQRTPYNAIG